MPNERLRRINKAVGQFLASVLKPRPLASSKLPIRGALLWGVLAFFFSLLLLTPILRGWYLLTLILVYTLYRVPWGPLDKDFGISPAWSVVAAIGAVGISLLAFKPRSVRPQVGGWLGIDVDTPWENWHVAALFWTAVVGFYSAYEFVTDIALVANAGNKQETPRATNALKGMLVILAFAILVTAAVRKLFPSADFSPILQVFLIAGFFCLIDGVAWYGMGGWSEARAEIPHELKTALGRVSQTLVLVDLPTFAAFGMLWWWLGSQSGQPLRPFIYGAISFQLLAAKGIFMLIEGGVLDPQDYARPTQAASA